MESRRIVVTGAAGKTGRAVVRRLAAAGHAVTALVHRPEQEAGLRSEGAATASATDLEDPVAVRAALSGHDGVYHVPPNLHPREDLLTGNVATAAEEAGVRRFVLHSVLAPYLPSMPHHLRKARSEERLRTSGLAWTVLQPASYMQNVLPYLEAVRRDGVLAMPYSADAAFTPVDLEDVAEVALRVLTDDAHAFASYELCGPQRLTNHDQAAALADLLGRPVRAEAQPVPEDAPDDLAAMFTHYDRYGLVGSGWLLERLLDRLATTFAEALARDVGGAPGAASSSRR